MWDWVDTLSIWTDAPIERHSEGASKCGLSVFRAYRTPAGDAVLLKYDVNRRCGVLVPGIPQTSSMSGNRCLDATGGSILGALPMPMRRLLQAVEDGQDLDLLRAMVRHSRAAPGQSLMFDSLVRMRLLQMGCSVGYLQPDGSVAAYRHPLTYLSFNAHPLHKPRNPRWVRGLLSARQRAASPNLATRMIQDLQMLVVPGTDPDTFTTCTLRPVVRHDPWVHVRPELGPYGLEESGHARLARRQAVQDAMQAWAVYSP